MDLEKNLERLKSLADGTGEEVENLLASLHKVENCLADILVENHLSDLGALKMFSWKGVSLQWCSSAFSGNKHIALCFKNGAVPETVDKFGESFLRRTWDASGSSVTHYVTLAETIELSELLPDYVAFFEEMLPKVKDILQNLGKNTEKAMQTIERVRQTFKRE